jgi:hypothetical protein
MNTQHKFIPRDQLVEGKQYYLYDDATYPATFVGRDDSTIYFRCDQKNSFGKNTKGPFKGCITFMSSLGPYEQEDDGFIEVDNE